MALLVRCEECGFEGPDSLVPRRPFLMASGTYQIMHCPQCDAPKVEYVEEEEVPDGAN